MNSPVSVLLVEDDMWLAEQFGRVLTKAGYTVSHVRSGVAAMTIIDEAMPTVIVLDMLLPGTTGMTLLHELQSYSDTGAIPIILCTNLASDIQFLSVEPYGVTHILDKTTMRPDDLVTAVRRVTL